MLKDKVVIVTGAAMGMGKSSAELFAENGAKVIIADFNKEEGQKVADAIKTDGGAIVNTSSVSGIRPQPANPAYVAAKHGVIGATKQAAMDYGDHNIRINSVAPGAIDTPMLRGALEQFGFDPDEYAKQLSMINRFAQPEEVGEANMWLLSDRSSYVTGAVLTVDGGYTAM